MTSTLCDCPEVVVIGPHVQDFHAIVPRTMIIDGNNLLVRCIKATERVGLSSGDLSTSALTAFIGATARLVRTYKSDYRDSPHRMVVCWDAGPSVYRTRLFPEYKAARRKAAQDEGDRRDSMIFEFAKRFLNYSDFDQMHMSGYEADDLVAAYWAMYPHDDKLIVSGDKDFLQLVDNNTTQVRPDNAGSYEQWHVETVQERFGCMPEQIPLYMALVGDISDGVPGVRGIGPKKALSGLQKADWVLDRVEALSDPGKLSVARTSLALVDLRDRAQHPPVRPLQRFRPVDNHSDPEDQKILVDFLESLNMERYLSQFFTGTLWR